MISGNIFLVGPMGAGKSTVGKQLAKSLGRDFYDSDKELEKRTGVSISWIFEMEGEQGFRIREQKIIDELTGLKDIVLATGGGVVLAEENRRVLRSRGHVVYLSASLEQLLKRTSKDKSRPLLETENPKQRIKDILSVRDPLYRDVADIELKTGEQSIQHVVSDLIKQLEQ
ncbi:MAG: shikimate kinase AroK, partial [Gammaproteobacteria bacterium]|nr:shikimate kinase AroK [Gammaproteobacteria bacterium]